MLVIPMLTEALAVIEHQVLGWRLAGPVVPVVTVRACGGMVIASDTHRTCPASAHR